MAVVVPRDAGDGNGEPILPLAPFLPEAPLPGGRDGKSSSSEGGGGATASETLSGGGAISTREVAGKNSVAAGADGAPAAVDVACCLPPGRPAVLDASGG